MSDSLAAPEWYPRQKLEIARRKLDRENPIFITADELKNGHEKKKIVITYNFNPVHEIHAFHRPTALLFSNISDVMSLLLYGTDSGTWHAVKLDLQRDSIIHTNLFDVENESGAAITVLEEFMRNDDHGVMIGRDDGKVEIYTFPDFEVDSIQIPSLLLKKHVGERILSFIGWADDVSSNRALDTLLVSAFSGHIYAITMLPHGSTEMNSKELIQILQRAKEETTVIENQKLKSHKQRKELPPVSQSKPKVS
ncbi:hypothetical protein HDU99_000623 [Rhizoclosmatium hyalinum]|nr:hypothetical protein HDU99_000623 [Rhizoclosmatium hyalinum]